MTTILFFLAWFGPNPVYANDVWLEALTGRFSTANIECFDKEKKQTYYTNASFEFSQTSDPEEINGTLDVGVSGYEFKVRIKKTLGSSSYSMFLEKQGQLFLLSAQEDSQALGFENRSGFHSFDVIFALSNDPGVMNFAIREFQLPLPGTKVVCSGDVTKESRN